MGTKSYLTGSYKDKDQLKGFHAFFFTLNSLDLIFQVYSIFYKLEVFAHQHFFPSFRAVINSWTEWKTITFFTLDFFAFSESSQQQVLRLCGFERRLEIRCNKFS